MKDNPHQQSDNVEDVSKKVGEDTSEVVSASELMAHYRRDAYGASNKYGFKSIIVKGQIKRVDKEELSHVGFVNQFIVRVVLWGEDPTPLDIKRGGDEVICSFSSDKTYSLQHLNTD